MLGEKCELMLWENHFGNMGKLCKYSTIERENEKLCNKN